MRHRNDVEAPERGPHHGHRDEREEAPEDQARQRWWRVLKPEDAGRKVEPASL
jgi:hypothetical protein